MKTTSSGISNRVKAQIYVAISFALVLGLLAIYGLVAWYYPTQEFVSVATWPAVGLGLLFVYLLWRKGALRPERSENQRAPKALIYLSLLLFFPFICWSGLVLGFPAAVTAFLEPNAEEAALVATKTAGRRVCDYKLTLVGYEAMFKAGICVEGALWQQVSPGNKVSLSIRKNYFGTRIFEIKPKQS